MKEKVAEAAASPPKPGRPRADTRRAVSPAAPIEFSATLLRPKKTGLAKDGSWTFLIVPARASSRLPSRGMVSVEGTLNRLPIRVTLEPDGRGGHWLKVDRKLLAAAGVQAGDTVRLKITPAEKEPEPKVPADLRQALAAAPAARQVWTATTPAARRDWIQWITSGKRAETRALRIGKACDMLTHGKRRPCCFDRSGIYSKSLTCPVADDT